MVYPQSHARSTEVDSNNKDNSLGSADDAVELAGMGYQQELKRSFSLLSMIGFAFSVLTW